MALASENGSANYQISIVESSTNTFKAKATSVVDFDGDGTMNEWEIESWSGASPPRRNVGIEVRRRVRHGRRFG